MQKQCDEKYPHAEHEYPGIPFLRTGFQHCLGVVPQQCVSRIPHEGHNFEENGKYIFCRGIAEDTKMKCGEFAPHLPHTWEENSVRYECEGDTGEEPRKTGYSPDDAREEKCSAPMVHNSHLWSNGKGTEIVWCPGSHEQYTQDCGKRYIHQSHMWTVEEDYPDGPYGGMEVRCPGWQTVDRTPSAAITQTVTDEMSPKLQETLDALPVVPHKWTYHVEVKGDSHLLVKKRDDGNWEVTVAKYNSAVYARIVADALNGGVLLGFEVED